LTAASVSRGGRDGTSVEPASPSSAKMPPVIAESAT